MDDQGWERVHQVRDAEAARVATQRARALRSVSAWRVFALWILIGGATQVVALVAIWQLEIFLLWTFFIPAAMTSIAWLIGITLQPRSATAIAWGIVSGIFVVSAVGSRWAQNNLDREGMVSGAILLSAMVGTILIAVLAAVHRVRSWTGR